ncbi:cell division FtsA domain-containing protein [Velocimicrobium porci]|uniref:Cell division protein FtsA n=1 Tax=Velocimicrobium porci TaxID=2606634 RepID=A0A6L5XZM3_9FIRM|nr:cell division FtsA domain-containing protein [Velocimicrobium porci]MSS63373.1 cell division protein FtsA [Velocimicrobium porci]
MEGMKYPDDLVFGLDIGTRSIVGTVGYREHSRKFKVIAHVVKEHETRAMLDGQIHDISKVSETIGWVKREIEQKIGKRLNDVCIAAAGRVLRTIQVTAEYEFQEETVVTDEHIYSLNMLGVEKAYEIIREQTKKSAEDTNFYCVGYTVIRYFMNDNLIINLEGHKASKIKTELLATFLPNEVIDGLYRSVERAGLYVANLTLEPIAAINVAIPEKFRLLNIALVDVGAGTSDICITKDGSIIAYGMIPLAGDELTELLAREYLTDFAMAEKIKTACSEMDSVEFQDIMGLTYHIDTKEVIEKAMPTIDTITKSIADKIIELNGGKSVSAVFVVGGGGKIPGFTDSLAKHLGIVKERVALRGEEVLNDIEFVDEEIKKDPLIVTPIGICLNYYEQKNNFIFVTVNGERIKLYDNDRLTIVDAAIQMGIQNEYLFPRRGKEINFTVDGKQRFVRGSVGEAAVVTLNGKPAGINSEIVSNDVIEITFSTVGEDASCEIRQLPEFNGTISFYFNDKKIVCPKFATVNGELVSEYYSIKEGDEINILNYYTLQQVLDFMDLPCEGTILVNHVPASLEEHIYDNFSINSEIMGNEHMIDTRQEVETIKEKIEHAPIDITVVVNGRNVVLSNKHNYILVDVLDFYPFNTKEAKGSKLITKINKEKAEFTNPVQEGDQIEIYWAD